MPKTRIPSPARSQGGGLTPRRNRSRRSHSVNSPGPSNTSGRLTALIKFNENNMDSLVLSPMNSRLSVLTDTTEVGEPRRKSWWKKLQENSRDVLEVLEHNEVVETNNILDELDMELLSQEKQHHTVDLPEISDSESICSIVIPQRKLFTQKENLPQNNYREIVGTRESMAKINKTNVVNEDKTLKSDVKTFFGHAAKRTKPVFPAGLLNISNNATVNKTKEMVVKEPITQVRNIFGNRPTAKRKNMFADFVVSESDDEIPEIEPKILSFPKRVETRVSSTSRTVRAPSLTANTTNDIEMDEWVMLPSSTMVENQLEEIVETSTPVKRAKLRKLSEIQIAKVTNTDIEFEPKHVLHKSSDRLRRPSYFAENIENNEESSHDSIHESNLNHEQVIPEVDEAADDENNFTLTYDDDNNPQSEANKNAGDGNAVEYNKTLTEESSPVVKETNEHMETGNRAQENLKTSIIENNAMEEIEEEQEHLETINNKKGNKLSVSQNKEVGNIDTELKKLNKSVGSNGSRVNKQDSKLNKSLNQSVVGNQGDNEIDNHQVDKQPEENIEDDINDHDSEVEQDEGLNESNIEQDNENDQNNDSEIENEEDQLEQNVEEEAEVEDENDSDAEEGEQNESQVEVSNDADSEAEEQNVSVDENEEQNVSEDENVEQNISEDENEEQNVTEDENEVEQNVSQDENEEQNISEDENEEQNVSEEENEEEQNDSVENVEQNESEVEVSNEHNDSEMEEQNVSIVENEDQNDSEQENEEQNESEVEVSNENNDSEAEELNEDESENEVSNEHNTSNIEESAEQDVSNEHEMEVDNVEFQNESDNEVEGSNEEVNESKEQNEKQGTGKVIAESPNISHDTTGRFRKKNETQIKSPEAVLDNRSNQIDSFMAKGRNTSIRKTKSMKNINMSTSLATVRESIGISDGTKDSSAEGSGWDSHRTTRKTMRQTLGKDFTMRKSLRALVMEKSAKRRTEFNEELPEETRIPQANSTEFQDSYHDEDVVQSETIEESDHEASRQMRQTTLEMYLQKVKKRNIEERCKMEEALKKKIEASLQTAPQNHIFKVPGRPVPRKQTKVQKPKVRELKLDHLPAEIIQDMKYKPPKRFRPSNASWITKGLYKFLETKLEPRYDYKARVRAEKLAETLYNFTKDLRRHEVAPSDAVKVLKHEMARLDIVRTHFDFYEFFHDFMPREIRTKVVPDLMNKIPLPKHGVFTDIL